MNAAEILKSTDSDIYTKSIKASDVDLLNIVKQVCELTGCSHDVAATTLFDSNYDLERAVNKIFEHPIQTTHGEIDQISNVWKEVAKTKKKPAVAELVQLEINVVPEIEITDNNQRATRGAGRGRARNVRGNNRSFDNNVRGRGGRRSQTRITTNRGRSKPQYNENPEPECPCNEWLSDDIEPETEALTMLTVIEDVLNPVEIVAKYSNKDGVFGDYSRTKAPPPSSLVTSNQPIRLVTANGVKSVPSMRTTFNFGVDLAEYCDDGSSGAGFDDCGDVRGVVHSDDGADVMRVHCAEGIDVRRVHGDESNAKRVNCEDGSGVRRVYGDDSSVRRVQETHTPTSPVHVPQCLPDTSYAPLMPPSPQLCPPPGMTNAHILQQIQNNQQYLSMLNATGGQSIFDLTDLAPVGSSTSTSNDNQLLHSIDSKDFLQKTSSSSCSPQDNSAVLSALQMSNMCCFPQIYMNNFANFLPPVPPGHNTNAGQSGEVNSKPLYTSSQRNYTEDDDAVSTGKHTYVRGPNYGVNYGKDEDQSDKTKMVAAARAQGRQTQVPPAMTSDPRFLAFQHHHHQQQQQAQQQAAQQQQHQSHAGYANNMYSCVTAPGPHPSAQHPYAMAHQAAAGIQQLHPSQLHMMQQQMHNFPQSYQFQEHLMTSMVPNAANRSVSGSSGNQARNGGRSNNTLWHPSN